MKIAIAAELRKSHITGQCLERYFDSVALFDETGTHLPYAVNPHCEQCTVKTSQKCNRLVLFDEVSSKYYNQ